MSDRVKEYICKDDVKEYVDSIIEEPNGALKITIAHNQIDKLTLSHASICKDFVDNFLHWFDANSKIHSYASLRNSLESYTREYSNISGGQDVKEI